MKGQTIKQFLSRLDFLLEETAASVKPELREGRRIHIIEENLMKAVSPNVREKILAAESLHFENGHFLTTEEKVEIASKQEALNNEFPEDEISVQLDQNG